MSKGFFSEQRDQALALFNAPKVLGRCGDTSDKGLVGAALNYLECAALVRKFASTGYDKQALKHARELLRESRRHCLERLSDWNSTQEFEQ